MPIATLRLAALLAIGSLLPVVHGVQALGAIDVAVRDARAQGLELVVTTGDVAIRDIPKALEIGRGGLFADPHYAGEPHWYPFLTPLLAAGVSALAGLPINQAYFATGALLGALLLVALALLLRSWAGNAGLAVLALAVLAGLVVPDDGVYPFATARLPFTVFMLAAGAAFSRDGARGRPLGSLRMFLAGGVLTGLLGVWHGASFVVASALSAVLLGKLAAGAIRSPDGRRERLVRAAAYALAAASIAALLFLPQLLRYGTLRQSDAARFWLLDSLYGAGDRPTDLFRLALLPRGTDALWLLAFAVGLVLAGSRRRPAVPLAIGYAFAKALAHLGFVLNAGGHPWLAALARRLLVVPPHTLNDIAEYTLLLAKLWVVATAVRAVLESPRARSLAGRAVARVPAFGREGVREAVALLATLALALVAAVRLPPPAPLFAQAIDGALPPFAERVAALLGPGETITGANGLIRLVPIKILAMTTEAHSNPYVHDERTVAAHMLDETAARGDWGAVGAILDEYRIRYVFGDGPLGRGCGEGAVLFSPQGSPVFRLAPGCGVTGAAP